MMAPRIASGGLPLIAARVVLGNVVMDLFFFFLFFLLQSPIFVDTFVRLLFWDNTQYFRFCGFPVEPSLVHSRELIPDDSRRLPTANKMSFPPDSVPPRRSFFFKPGVERFGTKWCVFFGPYGL